MASAIKPSRPIRLPPTRWPFHRLRLYAAGHRQSAGSLIRHRRQQWINGAAAGNDIGGSADQFNFEYQACTGDFDVSVRMAGLSPSDVWAKAGLMARETLDAGSRFCRFDCHAGDERLFL